MEEEDHRPSFMENVQRLFGFTRSSRRRLLDYRINDQDDEWTEKAINAVAKKLEKKRGAIDDLLHALSNPHLNSKCVTIPRNLDGRLQIAMRKGLPHVTFCKLWRWPDLVSHHELKPVDYCRSPYSTARYEDVCINPYHYERVPQPELPHVVVPRVVNQIHLQQQQQQQQLMLQQQQSRMMQQEEQITSKPSCATSASDLPAEVIAFVESFESNSMPQVPQNQATGIAQTQGIAYEEVLNQNFNKNLASSDSAYASSESACAYSSSCSSSFSPKSWSPPAPENWSAPTTNVQNNMLYKNPNPAFQQNPASTYAPNPAVVPYEHQPEWAAIAYYELNARVGEVFYCKSPRVTVDGYTCPMSSLQTDPSQAQTTRFCLGQFSNIHRNPTTENTRHHIGKGIELIYVCGQIWVNCHSDYSIFVQSLCSNSERGLAMESVDKVTNATDFKLFDEKYFSHVIGQRVYQGYQAVYDLAKWCSIRLSFVKGWGQNYPRRQVTETPCWIELRLHAPLKWIDNVVSQMVPGNSIDSVT